MKKQLMAMMVGAALMGSVAYGQGNYQFTFANGGTVPDADPSGFAVATNLAGMSGTIANLTMTLNISGGYNGDLYAFLAGPNGGFSVLMNRVGVSNSASQFGYGDSGLNVTFSDSAADGFHFYQNVGGYNLSGGTWRPDGINIDPQSSPSLFGSTSPSAFLSSFNNTDPNGTWTLFLADLSSGGQSTLVSWSLDITTAPEPSTLALTGLGLASAVLLIRRRSQRV